VLSSFWQGLGGKLADRWAVVGTPALVFWLGGLASVAVWHGVADSVADVRQWLSGRTTAEVAGVLVLALAVVGGSGVLVARLTVTLTRLMEGYGWPRGTGAVRRRLVARQQRRRVRAEEDYQRCLVEWETASAPRRDELTARRVRLEMLLRRLPTDPDPAVPGRLMPTRLGNVLRASECLPGDKYGLDAVICWPRLWLVLPGDARAELVHARAGLDAAVSACAWAVLFLVFTPWSPWAPAVTVAVAPMAYYGWVISRAQQFGDLVEATFDLYRPALYAALRWPLPATPAQERVAGAAVTDYLWRGSDGALPRFVPPDGQG
jgi:hypothetical protein